MILNFSCCLINNLFNSVDTSIIKRADEAGFYSSLLKSFKSIMLCLL